MQAGQSKSRCSHAGSMMRSSMLPKNYRVLVLFSGGGRIVKSSSGPFNPQSAKTLAPVRTLAPVSHAERSHVPRHWPSHQAVSCSISWHDVSPAQQPPYLCWHVSTCRTCQNSHGALTDRLCQTDASCLNPVWPVHVGGVALSPAVSLMHVYEVFRVE